MKTQTKWKEEFMSMCFYIPSFHCCRRSYRRVCGRLAPYVSVSLVANQMELQREELAIKEREALLLLELMIWTKNQRTEYISISTGRFRSERERESTYIGFLGEKRLRATVVLFLPESFVSASFFIFYFVSTLKILCSLSSLNWWRRGGYHFSSSNIDRSVLPYVIE